METYKTITVDMLTMHNAGPRLFLCIVTFYARWNVSQNVTICDLCQKCHTSKFTVKTSKYYWNHVNTHSQERKYYWKKNQQKFVWLRLLEQCGPVLISRKLTSLFVPKKLQKWTSNPQFWIRVCMWLSQNGSFLWISWHGKVSATTLGSIYGTNIILG